MKNLIVWIVLSFLTGGCDGQKKINEKVDKQMASTDTLVKPKVDVRVNKRYDNKGNLIQFDSTYSYYYSSPGIGRSSIKSDSLFGNFKSPLLNQYKDLMNENMNSIFFNDTLFKYDFYDKDYFSRRFHLNISKFEEIYRQMDSIKSD